MPFSPWTLWEKVYDYMAIQSPPSNGSKYSQAVLGLIVAAVTAAVSITATFYGTKDTLEKDIRAAVNQEEYDEHVYLNQQLAHYLPLDTFLYWRLHWENQTTQWHNEALNTLRRARP